MGKYTIEVTDTAKKDIRLYYQSKRKPDIRKLEKVFLELSQDPQTGSDEPQKLKGSLSGYWMRKVNKTDTIIYRIDESVITVFLIVFEYCI